MDGLGKNGVLLCDACQFLRNPVELYFDTVRHLAARNMLVDK